MVSKMHSAGSMDSAFKVKHFSKQNRIEFYQVESDFLKVRSGSGILSSVGGSGSGFFFFRIRQGPHFS